MTDWSRLPLFPLNVVLYPGERLPLHIFEMRYREMVRYCLDEQVAFGVVLVWEQELAQVGCTARIEQVVRRYEDGRLDLMTVGEERFRVLQTFEEQPYLTASVEQMPDQDAKLDALLRERAITQHLRLLELLGEPIRPSAYQGKEPISYYLAQRAGLTLIQKQDMLEMKSEADRLTFLVAHFQSLVPRLAEARANQRKVQSNGHFK